MTGQTYVYLIAASVFLIWAAVCGGIAIKLTGKNRALASNNRKLCVDLENAQWALQQQGQVPVPRRRKTATNTDYLIQEEEYV